VAWGAKEGTITTGKFRENDGTTEKTEVKIITRRCCVKKGKKE